MTAESGIYFVEALLNDSLFRPKCSDAVHWDRASRMIRCGGVRIEDNVLIGDEATEILTGDVAYFI